MSTSVVKTERRRQTRIQAVLPVRVRGTDATGKSFEELAHTLDLTPTGARLGSIRSTINALDTLVVLYRQRRMEFRVIWAKQLEGRKEHHLGLEAISQARESWVANLFQSNSSSNPQTGKEAQAACGAIG